MIEIEFFQDHEKVYWVLVWVDDLVDQRYTFVDRDSATQCYLHYCSQYPIARKVKMLDDED